jgi:hypothetical protein
MLGTAVPCLDASARPPRFAAGKEAHMVPLLLWILGVPGLIIILLLLLGVVHI